MPAIILSDNGATSGSAGLKTSGGNDGVLQLQTTTAGGTPTTAISISNTQVVTYTNQPTYTGGTANGVLYLNGSKAVTSGTALVFDGTNLGVGTTSPSGRFHTAVADGATNAFYAERTGASAVQFSVNFANQFSNLASSSVMTFSTNGSERMRLDTSGNLGLGVTPSAWAGGYKGIEILSYGGLAVAGGTTQLFTNAYYNGTNYIYRNTAAATYYAQSAGLHIWANAASGTAGNAISFTQAMTLDASGNLLVGTTTSAYKTTAYVSGQDGFCVQNSATGTGTGNGTLFGLDSSSNGVMWSFDAVNLVFGNTNTERARIDTSGNLGVGTTSPINYAPLTVAKAAMNTNIGQICAASVSAGDVGIAGMSVWKTDSTNTASQIFFKFIINNGGNGSGQINANGANSAAFGSYSDSRLKENIIELPSQLSNIMALRPVEFDYIESEGGGHQIGFIAQEMQEVYPDAVGVRQPDEMLTITGWSKTEARLVKAIQEQQAIIEQMQTRLAALEAK
jgi:hypothetical protein